MGEFFTILLGHHFGYLWAIFYAHGKQRSHFALIHADGTPLAKAAAETVIAADRQCRGPLQGLEYLAPPMTTLERKTLVFHAVDRYRKWLSEECGYIQLDGLPADTDLSATRLRLERLFVPLKAHLITRSHDEGQQELPGMNPAISVGKILSNTRHLALLAKPGGGKSTFLKRLATAYAFPDRYAEVADNLPKHDWLPLLLRCRELRDRAQRPILELLDDLSRHSAQTR